VAATARTTREVLDDRVALLEWSSENDEVSIADGVDTSSSRTARSRCRRSATRSSAPT
jgi:hypothetical protein